MPVINHIKAINSWKLKRGQQWFRMYNLILHKEKILMSKLHEAQSCSIQTQFRVTKKV